MVFIKTPAVIALITVLSLAFTNCTKKNEDPAPTPSCTKVWTQNAGNPTITFGQTMTNIAFNDPSVMKDGSTYRMWLSGGDPTSGDPVVRIYHATSIDGVTWTIDPTVLVEPSASGAWDDHRTETPNVIKVGSTYHMYYSGCKVGECDSGVYRTGHATSTDGTNWTKDPANPIRTYTSDPVHWGFYSRAEPGAVYDPASGKIFLYTTTMKARPGGTGDMAAMQGIVLSTSTDGSSFQDYDADGDGFADAVLTQSDSYPVTENYFGYSTPYAYLDGGTFHLIHDVARYPNPGDWRQVALARATSTDGIHFIEVEHDIFTNGGTSWTNWEIIGPAMLIDEGVLKIWFAGHKSTSNGLSADWTTHGIGTAVFSCP